MSEATAAVLPSAPVRRKAVPPKDLLEEARVLAPLPATWKALLEKDANEKAVTAAPLRKDIPNTATMAMANIRLLGCEKVTVSGNIEKQTNKYIPHRSTAGRLHRSRKTDENSN
jgi:hypothetical protein